MALGPKKDIAKQDIKIYIYFKRGKHPEYFGKVPAHADYFKEPKRQK